MLILNVGINTFFHVFHVASFEDRKPKLCRVANKLIRVFDKDGSGQIEFREYCALHQFLNAMQNAFFAADRDRSGYIDANEMFAAVSGAGFQLSFNTIQGSLLINIGVDLIPLFVFSGFVLWFLDLGLVD